jgi:hypothetical protein
MTIAHAIPIGQVFFVPREDVTLRDGSAEEMEAFKRSQEEFHTHKAAAAQTTSFGLTYSPHYLRQSRAQKESAND